MGEDYAVGYGRPPKNTRFKKGQSGNPRGRPKGTRNFRTDFEEELHSKIEVREDGQPIKISKQRALVKSLLLKALKADSKAIAAVIQLILRYSPEEEAKVGADQPLNEDEQELLAALKSRLLKETLQEQSSGEPPDEKVDEEVEVPCDQTTKDY